VLRRWIAAIAVALLSIGLVVVTSEVARADYTVCDPVTGECYIVI